MDLQLILEKLGYTKTTGEPFWGGPCATSHNTYEEMAAMWPSNNPPLSGEDVFESTWDTIVSETAADEYKPQRSVSGYAPIAVQLDMLYWDVYSGDFGVYAIQADRFIRGEKDVLILNPEYVKLAQLRGFETQALSTIGDASSKFIIWEGGLQVDNELAHGLVADCGG